MTERRFTAILVGLAATGLSMLSEFAGVLALPGWLLASFIQDSVEPFGFFFLMYAATFLVWAAGTHVVLTWKTRERHAA